MPDVLTKNKTDSSLTNEEIDTLLEGANDITSQAEYESINNFNEIVKLKDLDIQKVLREIDNQDLAAALKTANIEVKNKIDLFDNHIKPLDFHSL